MHAELPPTTPTDVTDNRPWWATLTRYHWFVLVVAALGWLFDTMDQQLFNLARGPAIGELHGSTNAQFYGGLATMIFMLGWATGGIVFGIMGDRIGRAKTMVLTILLYSLFTGLSALSVGFWDFAAYRFLTGLGVGGEFAVGVALVAEVMPDRARPYALGWLQACSAFGNMMAAFISIGLAPLEAAGALGEWKPWRWMFVVGALPALLALLIRRQLKEPERWQALRREGTQKLGSLTELFGDPTWRSRAILGLVLATSGVVGLWGIGFFSFDLVRSVFRKTFEAEYQVSGAPAEDRAFVRLVIHHPEHLPAAADQVRNGNFLLDAEHRERTDARVLYQTALELHKAGTPVTVPSVLTVLDAKKQTPEERSRRAEYLGEPPPNSDVVPHLERLTIRARDLEGKLTRWAGINGLLFNLGAFFGIYSFTKVTHYVGRKPAFAVTFLLALASTAYTFSFLENFSDVFWMVPVMGFCQIALFGGYAIYFPELFPTRLRSTGTSFCYNVGRYLAAPGPLLLGYLASMVFGGYGEVLSWRYAGVTMCSFFLLGLAVLPFAPETKGKPLPE
jgi:MFS family permease